MTGYYPNIVWKIMWVAVTPLSLAAILLYSLIDQLRNPILYGEFVGCGAVSVAVQIYHSLFSATERTPVSV